MSGLIEWGRSTVVALEHWAHVCEAHLVMPNYYPFSPRSPQQTSAKNQLLWKLTPSPRFASPSSLPRALVQRHFSSGSSMLLCHPRMQSSKEQCRPLLGIWDALFRVHGSACPSPCWIRDSLGQPHALWQPCG